MITTVPIRRTALALSAALLAASTLAACGDDSDDGEASATETGGGAFPVSIEHAFGETTIEEKPERIVTLGWNAQDVVYALGEEPVGMPSEEYGGTEEHIKPWLSEQFDPEHTTLFDTTDGPPIEQIAALEPDVILAPFSGFDKATYETLSGIAPTVAFRGQPWQTSWQDQTTMIGKALGKSDEAQKLVEGVGDLIDKTASEHPEFAGTTLSVLSLGAADYVYLPDDQRVQLLTGLGFENASAVADLAAETDDSQFAVEVSKEKIVDYDADVVVAYADGLEDDSVLEDGVYASMDAFERGSAYVLDDTLVIGAMSTVSVLSVPWVIERIVPGLSKAAKAAEG